MKLGIFLLFFSYFSLHAMQYNNQRTLSPITQFRIKTLLSHVTTPIYRHAPINSERHGMEKIPYSWKMMRYWYDL